MNYEKIIERTIQEGLMMSVIGGGLGVIVEIAAAANGVLIEGATETMSLGTMAGYFAAKVKNTLQ